jgi:hypothetical protein
VRSDKKPKSLLLPPAKELGGYTPLRFSFKHLDLYGKEKFSLTRCKDGYMEKLLCRLRDLCGLSVKDFRTNKSQSLKIHRITWSETSEVPGFSSLNEQLRGAEAWQFEVTKNEHGRVHGILLEDTFYIIWVDPDHCLYPAA